MKLLTASVEGNHQVPELASLISQLQPQIVTMTQAYHITDWAKTTFSEDYKFRQYSEALGSEATAVAVLIRKDTMIEKRRPMYMHKTWIGPVHGNFHQPRIYPVLDLIHRNRAFKLIGIHAPTHNNPEAQQETWNRLNRYQHNHPNARLIVLGDFNDWNPNLKLKLPSFRVIQGTKVDHIAFVNSIKFVDKTRHGAPKGLHGFVSFKLELVGGLLSPNFE